MGTKLNSKRVICSLAMILVFTLSFVLAMNVSKASEYEETDMMRGSKNRGVETTVTEAEYRLFVCIVYCEAGGEKYEGQLGVANVILNRLHSADWPNTLKDVIYQKHQFSPVKNGYLNKALAAYDKGEFNTKWHESCFKAVDDALAGKNNIGNRMYFMTPKALQQNLGNNYYDKLVIGNTAFFNTNW
ncbi:MAG: cell wall hydrolase [Lachnospiraceae bacterium]|nr:cell wall hydrolase [Lachnospiraceae bacterium]